MVPQVKCQSSDISWTAQIACCQTNLKPLTGPKFIISSIGSTTQIAQSSLNGGSNSHGQSSLFASIKK